MKRHFFFLAALLLIGTGSCKKHHVVPKVAPPHWTMDQTGKYSSSMTVVVQIPPNIRPYVQKTDQIGAFIHDECRGVGTLVEAGTVSAFFILIHGTASEQSKISFQYYSSWKSYLYETSAFLDFTADGTYGTADVPQILNLVPVR